MINIEDEFQTKAQRRTEDKGRDKNLPGVGQRMSPRGGVN